MKELRELESKIETRLKEILKKGDEGTQTARDRDEYVGLQMRLRELHNVMIMIKEMNK